jgi:hypothetical protein
MPKSKPRLSTTESKAYRDRLLRLRKMRIAAGPAGDLLEEVAPLLVEQLDNEGGSLYQLPLGEVALFAPARLTVFTSGLLITDAEVTTPWAELSLELSDAQECAYDPSECSHFEGLVGEPFPKCLNAALTRGVPLRPRKEYGVIFAKGWGSIPAECQEGTDVPLKLLLTTQNRNVLSFDFDVLVDRSIERKCQPRIRPLHKRLGLAELLSIDPLTKPPSAGPANVCFEQFKRLQLSLKDYPWQSLNETAGPGNDSDLTTLGEIAMR